MRDYGGEKGSEIGVDGHDVLLIPHRRNAPPHLTNPTAGRGAGGLECRKGGGLGRVGWGIGGLWYERNIVHICTYTNMLLPGLQWEKMKFMNLQVTFNHFQYVQRQNG